MRRLGLFALGVSVSMVGCVPAHFVDEATPPTVAWDERPCHVNASDLADTAPNDRMDTTTDAATLWVATFTVLRGDQLQLEFNSRFGEADAATWDVCCSVDGVGRAVNLLEVTDHPAVGPPSSRFLYFDHVRVPLISCTSMARPDSLQMVFGFDSATVDEIQPCLFTGRPGDSACDLGTIDRSIGVKHLASLTVIPADPTDLLD